MRLLSRSALLVLIVSYGAPTSAATPEDVQKAYENCVEFMSHGNRQPTPEAARAWAVEQCDNFRENSCPTPDGRWCDGFVKQHLGDVMRGDAEKRGIKLPH